ncbi:helix-turn-helix domain-containing protein [Nesterenkonia populi]
MVMSYSSPEVLERSLGAQFRAYRLLQDMDQKTLAGKANVSVNAVRNLESGKGSSLSTVTKVARALGRTDWLEGFYQQPDVSPRELWKAKQRSAGRRRASSVLRDFTAGGD